MPNILTQLLHPLAALLRIWTRAGFAGEMSRKLRVSLQSEGEGEDTLKLRDMATQSLIAQH